MNVTMLDFRLTIKMKAPMWGQNVEPWEVNVLALCSAFISWCTLLQRIASGRLRAESFVPSTSFIAVECQGAFLPQNFYDRIYCLLFTWDNSHFVYTYNLSVRLGFYRLWPTQFYWEGLFVREDWYFVYHTQGWPKIKISIFGQKISCGWLPCRLSEPTNLLHKWISEPTQPSQV